MALGYAPYLLKSLAEFTGADDPEYKLTATGFLKMLLASNAVRGVNVLKTSLPTGQRRTVQIKYRPRATEGIVKESDDCDIDYVPAYNETTLSIPRVAKTGIYVSFEDLRLYMADAIQSVAVGKPSTTLMKEHVERVMSAANAILGHIDGKLLGDITWGTNVVTGLNTATTLNINKDATKFDVNTGIGKLMGDADSNEMFGKRHIVGSGLFNNYQRQLIGAGLGQNGVNNAQFESEYQWYLDLFASASSNLGANQIGVFDLGAIGFADIDKFVGSFSGMLGVSELFQAQIPVIGSQNDGTINGMTFDMQLKPIDCPTSLLNAYGEETTYDKGYALFITKNYGLFQVPSDSYSVLDRLNGANGALRYTVTNNV